MRVFKRYKNRQIRDVVAQCYVSMAEVEYWALRGPIKVVDQLGNDWTHHYLTKVMRGQGFTAEEMIVILNRIGELRNAN